jgi:hypothetical protein
LRRLAFGALTRQHVATPFALLAFAPHTIELIARRTGGFLRFAQTAREPIALGGILCDLCPDALDLGTQLLQIGLGARSVLRRQRARTGQQAGQQPKNRAASLHRNEL